ncbi:hypothetical protein ACVWWO_000167 [Bradyrhizobium sp. F1.13.1]
MARIIIIRFIRTLLVFDFIGWRGIRTWLWGQAFVMLDRVGMLASVAIQIAITRSGAVSALGNLRNSETIETLSCCSLP